MKHIVEVPRNTIGIFLYLRLNSPSKVTTRQKMCGTTDQETLEVLHLKTFLIALLTNQFISFKFHKKSILLTNRHFITNEKNDMVKQMIIVNYYS